YTMESFIASPSLGFYIVGAPRYQHRGRIVVFVERVANHKQIIEGTQVGSYFGSVLCSFDFNKDGTSDVLLVGAPMYHSPNHGGLVTMYTFNIRKREFVLAGQLRGIDRQPYSRFGASISEVADLNGDRFMDLAVGAPLENNNQGSVYIFNGGPSLPITFSQRIEAAQVSRGLQYFGHSLHGVMDMSGDELPDLTVGSLGRVLVLRSRPVISVQTTMTFTPDIIKMDNNDCNAKKQVKIKVCFILTKITADQLDIQSVITYNLLLDSVRTQFRAFFKPNERNLTATINTKTNFECRDHIMTIPECPEDSLNSIGNEVNFQFSGLSVNKLIGLKPILDPRSSTKRFFQKLCMNPITILLCCYFSHSENGERVTKDSFHSEEISVKFAVNIQVKKVEDSTNDVNFTVGKNNMKKFVEHCYEVENFGLREIPVNVTIKIPVELGGKPVWSDQNTLVIPNCTVSEEGPSSNVDFVEKLRKDQTLVRHRRGGGGTLKKFNLKEVQLKRS
ncbi:integrin alpha-X-like, partial [Acipenser oxyrinchus oxyrinchus]